MDFELNDEERMLQETVRAFLRREIEPLDREYGEWYWGVLADGSVGPRGTNKGEEWKASYHAVRALVFTSDWIGAALGESGKTR